MSSTEPTSGGTGSGTTQLPADAVRFCKDMFQKVDLLKAYYAEISTASKNKTYEAEIIDNWLVSRGYHCTVEQVLLAQKQLPAYQLYYWSGGYKTLVGTSKSAGPVFTIHAYGTGPQQIGYGTQFIIDPQFSNLLLSWNSDDGTNETSGALTFTLSSATDGTATRSFYGTITDSSGTQPIAGVLMSADELQKAAASGKAPPGQDMSALQIAEAVVNFVAQTTFITLNFVMLYKAGKEIQQLKKELAGKPDDPDLARAQARAEKQQTDVESSQEDALGQGDRAQENVDQFPEQDVESTMSEVVQGSPETPLDLPAQAQAPSEAQQDLLNEAVQDEVEPAGEGDDRIGGDTGGGDDDAGDVFEDIGGLAEDAAL
jgi:hypothetical protein